MCLRVPWNPGERGLRFGSMQSPPIKMHIPHASNPDTLHQHYVSSILPPIPLQIPSTNFVSLALAPIISLQISSTNVMSVAFPLQLCPDIFLLCSIRRILSTLPLQIPSTYVTSDAFSRQFCYRNHLPVLCQHRYICVFGERRASLHLYID